MTNLDTIVKLKKEDFEQRSFDEVRKIWEDNHDTLLNYVKSTEIPYFGLHGTSEENLKVILESKGGYFNVGTFYDKKRTEKRLIQLYHMCRYVASYTISGKSSAGGILVFNVDLNGKNITSPWEHLFPGSFYSAIKGDSKNQARCFESLSETENLLWRASHPFKESSNLSVYNFSERYKGLISMDSEKLKESLTGLGFSSIPMSILRDRIMAQNVLAQSLKLLSQPKPSN